MNKKYLSLFLVLMMMLSIFAGCSAKTEAPQKPADSQEATSFQYMTDQLKQT